MANPCGYCDEIETALMDATKGMDTFAARMKLTEAGLGDIVKKLDNKQPITDAEFNKLWENPATRSDGIRVMENAGKDLVKKIADDAIKNGDELTMMKVSDEIKKTAEICVRKEVCPIATGTAIGLGAIATVGTLGVASGVLWDYDEKQDAFIRKTMVGKPPDKEPWERFADYTTVENKWTWEQTVLPTSVADAYKAYIDEGYLAYRKYSLGAIPGYQGRGADISEWICQNFAISAADYINSLRNPDGSQKYFAQVVNIIGRYDDPTIGEPGAKGQILHAAIVLIDKTKPYAYVIDPMNKLPSNQLDTPEKILDHIMNPLVWEPSVTLRTTPEPKLSIKYEKTLVEPQYSDYSGTIQVGESLSELVGTKMSLGDAAYTIDHIEYMDKAEQQYKYQGSKIGSVPVPTDISNTFTSESNLTSPEMMKQAQYGAVAQISPWESVGSKSKVI